MRTRLLGLIPLVLAGAVLAAPVKLTFEDKPTGTNIRKDYLGQHGVEFSAAHICQPGKGVASGSKALCDGLLGAEFSQGPMTTTFSGPQKRVTLYAGHPMTVSRTYTVTMKAFDVNGHELTSTQATLSPALNPVAIQVAVATAAIRSVTILYSGVAFEMIDDLEFDNGEPTPDTTPPVVKITKPAKGQTVQGTFFELRGTIIENEGLVSVEVKIQPASGTGTSFGYFDYDDSVKPVTFGVYNIGELTMGPNQITVKATDIGGNTGSDTVTVNSVVDVSALRKLGVYSLSQYENTWKGDIIVDSSLDPYYDFWDLMVNGMGAYSVDKTKSKRFHDSEVTAATVIPGVGTASWEDFDLVFFYGHNNMITKPQPNLDSDSFTCETWSGSAWTTQSCDLTYTGWGTVGMPFDYYADHPLTNAGQNPGAVTYLYNSHTASLLGAPYDYGGGARSYKLKWGDPVKKVTYGRLGSQNLKWLVLHGCKAVINGDKNGNYLGLANAALTPVHGGYHMILGHRESFSTGDLVPIEKFGRALVFGRPVQEAYFEIDPFQNSSAIAAENTFSWGPESWETSTMERDNWSQPVTVPKNAFVFSERWIRKSGSIGQHP